MAIVEKQNTLKEIEDEIERQLMLGRKRDSWQGGGARSMPTSTMEHAKGMHNLRHQQSIPHSTGEGTIFQQLDRLAREKARLLKRAKLWASKLTRECENVTQVDRERELLLRGLEPRIRSELQGISANPAPPSSAQGDALRY